MGKSTFITADTGQSVITVGQRHDLRINRYLFADQSVRITAAVPFLMVPAANIVMIAVLLFILLQTVDTFQNLTAVQRMLLHNCKFFCRQPTGFIQDIVRDRDLTYVMQCRRHRNILDGLIAHFIFGILPSQLLQHDLGQLTDTLDMLS